MGRALHGWLLTDIIMLAAPAPLQQTVSKSWLDFTHSSPLRVAMGTYNINGGKHFRSVVYKDVSLDDWLLDGWKESRNGEPDENIAYIYCTIWRKYFSQSLPKFASPKPLSPPSRIPQRRGNIKAVIIGLKT